MCSPIQSYWSAGNIHIADILQCLTRSVQKEKNRMDDDEHWGPVVLKRTGKSWAGESVPLYFLYMCMCLCVCLCVCVCVCVCECVCVCVYVCV